MEASEGVLFSFRTGTSSSFPLSSLFIFISAPNYAAVLALCSIGGNRALDLIDRAAMYNFFMSVKDPSGGFRMHRDGEVDTRGTYTVIAVARILNILTPELTEGVAEYILRCQTYEGGFGGEPFNEAHGGYNFCALASIFILGQVSLSYYDYHIKLIMLLSTIVVIYRGRSSGCSSGKCGWRVGFKVERTSSWTHAIPSGREPRWPYWSSLEKEAMT